MSDAIAALGTLIQRGDGATPENFTTIAEVRDIGGPELSTDVVDVTSHGAANATEEKLATLKRTGDVSFVLGFIPTAPTHSYTAGLLLDWYNRTRRNFKLILPDAGSTEWAFSAYVTKFALRAPVAADLTAELTLTIAGSPTLA